MIGSIIAPVPEPFRVPALTGRKDADCGLVMAGAALTFIFPLAPYIFLRKQFMEGITLRGIRG